MAFLENIKSTSHGGSASRLEQGQEAEEKVALVARKTLSPDPFSLCGNVMRDAFLLLPPRTGEGWEGGILRTGKAGKGAFCARGKARKGAIGAVKLDMVSYDA